MPFKPQISVQLSERLDDSLSIPTSPKGEDRDILIAEPAIVDKIDSVDLKWVTTYIATLTA